MRPALLGVGWGCFANGRVLKPSPLLTEHQAPKEAPELPPYPQPPPEKRATGQAVAQLGHCGWMSFRVSELVWTERASTMDSTGQACMAEEAGECSGYEHGLWGLAGWVPIPTLLLGGCVP